MSYPLPLTRTEAYLAYKAGVIQQSDLKQSLAVPRNGIDAWLAYWTGLTNTYPVKNVGKNLFNITSSIVGGINGNNGAVSPNPEIVEVTKTDTSVVIYSPTNNYKGIVTDKIAVSEGEKLTLSWGRGEETTPQYVAIFFYGDDDTFLSRGEQIGGYSTVETTATAPSGAAYARCAMEVRDAGDTVTFYNIMAEKSASATSFEPYTGGPLILQEEEAYIAYLSGVINEYPEKCLRRVGAYLRYLISARWGRPDHPLNREELYLSLLKTQVIPSGDPSSDIEIDGTAKAPFQDVKMYGDTFQKSYTGKNLLQFIPKSGEGMTTTYNTETGLVHVSGTNSSPDGKWSNICETAECSIPAGTYTLSVTEAQSNVDFHIRLRYTDDSTGDFYIVKNNTSKTFEMPKDAKRVYIWYGGLTPAYSSVDFTVGIQLEAGSEATSFEPYVGGVPAPNPDYPQLVQTVTGEQTVTVVGKNLLNLQPESSELQGVKTVLNIDGTITVSGTCSAAWFDLTRRSDRVALKAGTYTMSLTESHSDFGISFRGYDAVTGGSYTDYNIGIGKSSVTFTLTKDVLSGYIWASGTSNGRIIDATFGIQIEKSSSATTFDPYSKQTYEINLGKNLFDNTGWRQGQYNNGEWTDNLITRATTSLIPIEPTTYTISLNSESLDTSFININYFDSSKNWLGNRSTLGLPAFGNVSREQTFTLPRGAAYLAITIRPYETDSGNIQGLTQSSLLMLEKGSSKTDYAPYFTPIELCKLDTYQDYIWKDGDSWKVHKAITKITVDGSEGWVYASNYNYARCPSYTFVDIPLDNTGTQLSDYFEAIADWGTFRDSTSRNAFFPLLNSGYKISIRNTDCTSTEDYTSWLSANKPSFYYPVETPTDTTITDTTLIAQLEALVSGGAENGTTYIKVNATDPNLPGLLYVEAPKYE